jgi:SAM-dependent methyltransferase
MLHEWLKHPLTRAFDLDDPQTTELRRQIIYQKRFLYRIYFEWYQSIVHELPQGIEPVLELGSGAGFLEMFIPRLITSEVFRCSGIRVVLDARALPLGECSLRAIVMTDVLHHIPDVHSFFIEAARCVKPNGAIIMVEPWHTRWSRLIYEKLHHEPFLPEQQEWELPSGGPLSGANGALPWILFSRDRAKFELKYPEWHIKKTRVWMPLRYLVSGGVSMRDLMPEWTFELWKQIEQRIHPVANWGMFAFIVLERSKV